MSEELESESETRPVSIEQESVLTTICEGIGGAVDPRIELPGTELESPAGERLHGAKSPRYQVGREIARGGMGAILEMRDEDLRRTIAMKVMLPERHGGPPEADRLHRFLEEAQVTAQLSHPGVVPVHELGADAQGRPFFTMALVRGRTLTSVFRLAREEREGWTVTRALQALVRVCETVAFAHRKGVVHRDLKPDNIMVGSYGQVYVMDWGLAKVKGHESTRDLRIPETEMETLSGIRTDRSDDTGDTDSPLLTRDGTVIGTPYYMPPEQALGKSDDIDARSDVYALGALLYELLAGHPPYWQPGARMSAYTVLACVLMQPPRPVEQLQPDTPAELAAVVARAMSREPAERHTTADELGADIRGYLDRLAEAKEQAERGRRAAEADRSKAEDLVAFMLGDLIESLRPLGQLRLLRRVAEKARAYYDEVPAAEATEATRRNRAKSLSVVGDVFDLEGDQSEALAVRQEGAEILAELADQSPPDSTDRLALAQAIGRVGLTHMRRGEHTLAAEHFERALAICLAGAASTDRAPEWLRTLASAWQAVGHGRENAGETEEAERAYTESAKVCEELDARHAHGDTTRNLWCFVEYALSALHRRQGHVRREEQHARRAVEIAQRFHDEDPSDQRLTSALGRMWSALAGSRKRAGDHAEAAACLRKSLAIQEELVRHDPANTMWASGKARSLHTLGLLQMEQGDLAAARETFEDALAIRQRLARRDESNQQWAGNLFWNQVHLGEIARGLSQPAQARLWLESAQTALASCQNRWPDQDWSEAEQRLAKAATESG